MTPVLQVTALAAGYDEGSVVRGVDFELHRGELVVLLGDNGSGKSTIVKAVLGLARVHSGTVRLFGERPSAASRRRVGYVSQRTVAPGGLPATVEEVVGSGRVPQRRWWRRPGQQDRSAVSSALASVRLNDRRSDVLSTLSGGQQRRALIARALAAQPEVLVMDEPTAGVDAANVDLLAKLVGDWKRAGLALLVVAHGTGPLRPLVDRAVVLARGQVSYSGPLTTTIDQRYDDRVPDDHHLAGHVPFAVPDEPRL